MKTATITGGTINNVGLIQGTSGASAIDGATISNTSTIEANGGTVTLDPGTVTNTGTLTATDGGTLVLNTTVINSGAGEIVVGTNSIVDLNQATIIGGAITGSGSITSTGSTELSGVNLSGEHITIASGTLALVNVTLGTISGFGSGDAIDLKALTYSAANESLTWNSVTGVLAVTNGTQTETVSLAGAYLQSDFALTEDSVGGTEAVWSPIYLVAGATATFTGGGSAVALDPAFTVSDTTSTTLAVIFGEPQLFRRPTPTCMVPTLPLSRTRLPKQTPSSMGLRHPALTNRAVPTRSPRMSVRWMRSCCRTIAGHCKSKLRPSLRRLRIRLSFRIRILR